MCYQFTKATKEALTFIFLSRSQYSPKKSINKFNALTICHNNRKMKSLSHISALLFLFFLSLFTLIKKPTENNCVNINISAWQSATKPRRWSKKGRLLKRSNIKNENENKEKVKPVYKIR